MTTVTPAAAGRGARYDTLDAWRGVACVMVVIYHATLVYTESVRLGTDVASNALRLAGFGYLGVPMFFVISGYCILAAADRSRGRERPVRTYFFRRFRRIYPPLWAVIAASVLFFLVVDAVLWPGVLWRPPHPLPRPWWYSGWQWLGNITLTESWRHHVIGDPRGHFPGQAWTLCYEEQFYAVTGLLLLLRPSGLFGAAVVVTVLSGVAGVALPAMGIDVSGFFFDGHWFMFAAGMLVYQILTYRRAAQRPAAAMLAVSGAVCCAWGDGRLGTSLVFAAVLLLLHRFDERLPRTRFVSALNWCGVMCYSLYLVHPLPVKALSAGLYAAGLRSSWSTVLVVVPLSLVVALALGRLFFELVERRFLNQPSGRDAIRARPLAVPTRVVEV